MSRQIEVSSYIDTVRQLDIYYGIGKLKNFNYKFFQC